MEPEMQYKTFFIYELNPWIKKNFRTTQIGITGLSMGGHSWNYWINTLDDHLRFFKNAFNGSNIN